MGPAPVEELEQLDNFIKELEPEEFSVNYSDSQDLSFDTEFIQPATDLGEKGYSIEAISEVDAEDEDNFGEESLGYAQIIAFCFVTASYLLDDYLKRNNLHEAVSEAKRRSWIVLLALALMSHIK